MKPEIAIGLALFGWLAGCQAAAPPNNPIVKVATGGAAVCGDIAVQNEAFHFARETVFKNLDETPSPYAIAFHLDGGSGPPSYDEQADLRMVPEEIRLLAVDHKIGKTSCSLPLEFTLQDGTVGQVDIEFWTQMNAAQDDYVIGLEGLLAVNDVLAQDRSRFLFKAAMNPVEQHTTPNEDKRDYASEESVTPPVQALRNQVDDSAGKVDGQEDHQTTDAFPEPVSKEG